MSSRRKSIGFLVLSFLCPSIVGGQVSVVFDDAPRCTGCRIELSLQVSLGGMDGPGVGRTYYVARESTARYWVASPDVPGVVGIYTADGEFVDSLDRKGEGPGEFRTTRQLVASSEGMSVFDPRNRRETLFGHDRKVIRTNPMPAYINEVVFLVDSLRVYNMVLWSPERAGYPLHLVDSRGEILQSFGDNGEVFRRDYPELAWRVLAKSGERAVWAGRSTQYLIEKWSAGGEKLMEVWAYPDSVDR